jgi:hypothetical protein
MVVKGGWQKNEERMFQLWNNFNFMKKDIKTRTYKKKKLENSSESCLQRGDIGDTWGFRKSKPAIVKYEGLYTIYKMREYFILCKVCGSGNYLFEEEIEFIKTEKYADIKAVEGMSAAKYTDF